MLSEFMSFLRGDVTFASLIAQFGALLFVLFCTLPIHEFAHAKVADMLGDDTPRLTGRLSLNPLAHLDLIGSIMILAVGFGYAKPVKVNMRNFKNPRGGMALTALAGPVSNLIMAFLFAFLSTLFYSLSDSGNLIFSVAGNFFFFAGYVNISLAVFNFLPIPPLDGSRIATLLIPSKYYFKIMQYERIIMIALMLLIFMRVLSIPLNWLTGVVAKGIFGLWEHVFGVI